MCKKGLPAVWTKEKIEEAFAGFVEKNRRLPVAREMKPQYGLPTRRTFERYMDTTAQEYAELRYPTLLSARDERHVQTVLAYRNEVREWSIERLMEAEKNFFAKCGRLPEPYEYTAENGLPMYSVFCRLAKEAFEEMLRDGMAIMTGGYASCGIPDALLEAVEETGVKNLTIISNDCAY